jgi:integrase/recombinase XerD
MRPARLTTLVQTFFEQHLPVERNLSPNTVLSYRDTMLMFLGYVGRAARRRPDELDFEHVDAAAVRGFLDWLRDGRRCASRTSNQRLAALKTFFRYVASVAPEHIDRCRQIREIPSRRVPYREPRYLEPAEVEALLHATKHSRDPARDRALVAVFYNTGARVQEVVDLDVADLILEVPPRLHLRGKGRKERTCPLWANTVGALRQLIAGRSHGPIFLSSQRQRLTRSGVAHILKTLASRCRLKRGDAPVRVTPHVIRHTTAMHLLRSNVDLAVISAWLGHADLETTHDYVEIDLRMKQAAVAGAALPEGMKHRARYPRPNLIARLKAIGRGEDHADLPSASSSCPSASFARRSGPVTRGAKSEEKRP